MIVLKRGGVACTVDPELGGSLLSLSVNGNDLLRPSSLEPQDVLHTACFPLVPFANRIADGRMTFHGRQIVLPPDPAAPPHAHHGHGWRRPWRLVEKSGAHAELEYRHAPDAWPWAYVAIQRIALIERGAEIDVSVTNGSDEDMPAGLGLHPYFVRGEADTILVGATRMIMSGRDGIPSGEGSIIPGEKSLHAIEGMDNLLLDESGEMHLRSGGVQCVMKARGAVGFHVYIPEGEKFFCVEPVSHRPNAFSLNAQQHAIKPGETRRLIMELTALS
jgi:aldose 1-epimerase